ncbi:MAG: hypothetical protein M1834_006338 [Cirrosporium novae-zelandiae]|nr:MAG: hypothetical protein M1834_006338 [Cirrosporium novae-zelandiae]
MIRRNDPRIRHTLNQISQNIEHANESTQTAFYTFTQNYVSPCFSSIESCVESCTAPCFPSREERLRRKRGRSRGRAELNFDFYDDWDEDESAADGFMGWGNDELDRLLAGSSGGRGATRDQPQRQRAMSYGSRGRRNTTTREADDPNVIPRSSVLGFLESLPWKIGGRGVKYRPSAADLQEHPGSRRFIEPENEPLIEGDESDNEAQTKSGKHQRQRSNTTCSRETTNSLSSRGDLFPSDGEDDAVPIDDEFATALERRPTGLSSDDRSSGRTHNGKRPARSRTSTRTRSSNETKPPTIASKSPVSIRSFPGGILEGETEEVEIIQPGITEIPLLSELKKEEDRIQHEEERSITLKREAARRLAKRRGLSSSDDLSLSKEIYTPEDSKSNLQSKEDIKQVSSLSDAEANLDPGQEEANQSSPHPLTENTADPNLRTTSTLVEESVTNPPPNPSQTSDQEPPSSTNPNLWTTHPPPLTQAHDPSNPPNVMIS